MEGKVLFNDARNTFYLRLYGVEHVVKDDSSSEIHKTRCRHYMGYSLRLAARDILYAPYRRQDSTYHSLVYNSRTTQAGMRSRWMIPLRLCRVQRKHFIL